MCNLYRARSSALEIARTFSAQHILGVGVHDEIYPKRMAPVIRQQDGVRILEEMLWGFPPPAAGNAPVTNVRNLASPFWRSALANPERRCLVPATEFCEWEGEKGSKVKRWFSVSASPLFAFAGIWRPIGPEAEAGKAFAFLTCEPNPLVALIHPKAMPVILQPDDYDGWLSGEYDNVCALAAPFPSQLMAVD